MSTLFPGDPTPNILALPAAASALRACSWTATIIRESRTPRPPRERARAAMAKPASWGHAPTGTSASAIPGKPLPLFPTPLLGARAALQAGRPVFSAFGARDNAPGRRSHGKQHPHRRQHGH